MQALATGKISSKYEVRHGLLYYKDRIYLPPNSATRNLILQELHTGPSRGHLGFQQTFRRVARDFYRPGMTSFIKKFVRECDICQRSKSENVLLARKLPPLPIPSQVWTDQAMDFIEGLPKFARKDTTFVVVDRLSKYAHFFALSHPFTTVRIAQIFFDNIFKLHGLPKTIVSDRPKTIVSDRPKTIVSDRDKVFVSTFWRELFAL